MSLKKKEKSSGGNRRKGKVEKANCISRVKVDENEFERKKREAQEEAEEKERLRKLTASAD